MTPRNVLIFPAGTEIGLEIHQALQHCKEVRLFGAGQDVSNHARFVYPRYHVVPSIHEAGWLDALNALCDDLRIDYIFPAYDDVIVALSREVERIRAQVISAPSQACEITRSKASTYRILAGKVRVPVVYTSAAEVGSFPVIVKPDRGQGSFGVTLVRNATELEHALAHVAGPVVCEYLPGDEYTIDCFSDRERGVLFAGARARNRTRNGIAVNSVTVDLPEAEAWAQAISDALAMRGAWFFQVKRSERGELTLLEVGPRIAGSMATHRVQGVNFPLLSIFEAERLPVSVKPNAAPVEIDRALCNRYAHSISFSHIYIDLDDTLLLNGEVNLDALRLVFKCVNEGKRVTLVTRHAGDLPQTLARHRLSGVFDEIIHLTKREKKSAYIQDRESIYVDDSFSERRDVQEVCGIPTFDCSMIELLINDRPRDRAPDAASRARTETSQA